MMNNKCKPKDKIAMNVCGPAGGVLPTLTTYMAKLITPQLQHGKNILCQRMMELEKTKYVIKWDFDLDGKTITVPEHCILEFDGGSLKNGTIIGQDTYVNNVGGVELVFGAGITQEGTWRYSSSSSDPRGGISREEADKLYQPKGSYQPAGDYPTTPEVEEMIGEIEGGKDKEYNPAEFSGLGKVYLKKNIVEVGGVEKNVLVQDAFYKDGPNSTRVPNTDTIFVVQFDFDLNGATVNIPADSVLEFEGGSIVNGKIVSNHTVITGDCLSSNTSLFGVFYDIRNNPLGWDKQTIKDWKGETEFGNFIRDIEPGEYFGYNQSMAMNEKYFFVVFSEDYTENDKTLGRVTIVLYDRNYNYKGYSILGKPSHANGITVCDDGYIYIATSSNTLLETESVHKVNIQDLITNCLSNKGRAKVNSTVTPVEVIALGKTYHGIDYDPDTETFVLAAGGFDVYDKSFNLIKTSSISNYRNYALTHIGRDTVQQDIVYKNGILYAFDWDKTYTSNDGASNGGVCYIVDIGKDEVVDIMPLSYGVIKAEPEGVCKDPVTGVIYTSCNHHTYHRAVPAFTVSLWTYNNNGVGAENRQKIVDAHWINEGTNDVVYVDNLYGNDPLRPEYDGPSLGTRAYPYKSIGQAMVMTMNTTARIEFGLVYTVIDYYSYKINYSDVDFRIFGATLGPNNEYPVLDAAIALRHCTFNMHQIALKPSSKHPNDTYSLTISQFANLYLTNCIFNVNESGGNKRNIGVSHGCDLRISSCSFENSKEFTSHIVITGHNSYVGITSATVKDGALVNPGDNITDKYNHVSFNTLENITLEGTARIIYSKHRDITAVFLGNITTLEELELIRTFSENIQSQSFYFRCAASLHLENGGWMPIGMYFNDFNTDGEGNTIPVFRSMQDSRNYDGIVSGPKNARPDASKTLSGVQYFDTDLGCPIWGRSSQGWIKADGTPADLQTFISDGINIIRNSEAPTLRNDGAFGTNDNGEWRKTQTSAENPPAVVDVSFGYLDGIERGFNFSNEIESYVDIAYDLPLSMECPYVFSCWVKGHGTIKLQVGKDSVKGKSFVIDSDSFILKAFSFVVSENMTAINGYGSVYLGVEESDSAIVFCAPKLEKGAIPTIWSLDSNEDNNLNENT